MKFVYIYMASIVKILRWRQVFDRYFMEWSESTTSWSVPPSLSYHPYARPHTVLTSHLLPYDDSGVDRTYGLTIIDNHLLPHNIGGAKISRSTIDNNPSPYVTDVGLTPTLTSRSTPTAKKCFLHMYGSIIHVGSHLVTVTNVTFPPAPTPLSLPVSPPPLLSGHYCWKIFNILKYSGALYSVDRLPLTKELPWRLVNGGRVPSLDLAQPFLSHLSLVPYQSSRVHLILFRFTIPYLYFNPFSYCPWYYFHLFSII